MRGLKFIFGAVSVLITIGTSPISFAHNFPPTLKQAENFAISQSPELKEIQAKQNSLSNESIAAGQLADPKLIAGGKNLPTDTFALNQEAMTQIQVGIQQRFPKGRSLTYRSEQKSDLAHVEHEKGFAMHTSILREVRMSWIKLYYASQAKHIIEQQKQIYEHLVKVTESLLANNKVQQQDVIQAQLEVSALENHLFLINQQIDTARAQLARWVGQHFAARVNPSKLPHWRRPPSLSKLQVILDTHPELKVDQAMIVSNQSAVALARQQYWPGFTLGAAYGFRDGHNPDGDPRADFLTLQISIDLPIFPKNRQDRQLAASQENLLMSEAAKHVQERQLQEDLATQYAAWHALNQSVGLYQTKLRPQARHYAQAMLLAYQNGRTDFSTLSLSYDRELKIHLAELQANVDRAMARTNLLYMQGQ